MHARLCNPVWLFLSLTFFSPLLLVLGRAWLVGLGALCAFSIFERWPRELPPWLARWVLQLLGIVLMVPCTAFFAYWVSAGGSFDFLRDELRLAGVMSYSVVGIMSAPWIALAAMLRQREAFACDQQTAFALERSKLEREALDARMRLLQAQVRPHFLFNTLANVQALVDTGSPKASQVLGTLIAYLRASVPVLDEPFTTLGDEIALRVPISILCTDVHMPGLSGMDAAHAMGRRAHVVFVTAYDQYAVRAFAEGALDYLVKPVEETRLRDTIERLKLRVQTAAPALNTEELLPQLAEKLRPVSAPAPLRWIRASVGNALHLIPVDAIDFLRSDDRYTLVAWHDANGAAAEYLLPLPSLSSMSWRSPAPIPLHAWPSRA